MYIAYISSVSMVKQSIKSTERQSPRFIPFFSIIVLESYDKFIRVNTMNYPLLLLPFFFFPPQFYDFVPIASSPSFSCLVDRGKGIYGGIVSGSKMIFQVFPIKIVRSRKKRSNYGQLLSNEKFQEANLKFHALLKDP